MATLPVKSLFCAILNGKRVSLSEPRGMLCFASRDNLQSRNYLQYLYIIHLQLKAGFHYWFRA